MKTKAKKNFDCVEFKRQAQERIYEAIKNLSPEEEIAYFRKAAQDGPLGSWVQRVQERAENPHSD